MPQLISDDLLSQTFVTDDGRTVTVAKPFGAPFAPDQPAPDATAAPPPDASQPAPAPAAIQDQPPPGPEQPAPSQEPVSAPVEAAPPPEAAPPAPPALAPQAEPASLPTIAPAAVPTTSVEAAQLGVRGLQAESDARQREAAVQSEGQTQVAAAYDEANRRVEEQQRARDAYIAQRQAEENKLMTEKRSMIDRFVNHRVDRNRVFHRMDTGDKVISGIGLALGALGAAFTKADDTNQAFDYLMKTLDDDVKDQMAERDKLGTLIGMKSDEIADFRQVSTSRAGEYATRMAAYLERLGRDVAKIAAKTSSQTVKENAKALGAQASQKAAELLGTAVNQDRAANEAKRARQAQIAEAQKTRVLAAAEHGFTYDAKGNLVPMQGKTLSVEDQYKQTQIDKNKREAEQAQRGRVVVDTNGKEIGLARYGDEKGGASSAADVVKAHGDFRKTLLRLNDIIKAHGRVRPGFGWWPADEKQEAERLRVDLANQLAKMRDPNSANREGEVQIAMKDLPEMDNWVSSKKSQVVYGTVTKTADDRVDDYLSTHLENYDKKNKSPTLAFQAMDRASQDTPDAANRVDILKEAASPPSQLTLRDPEIRARVIQAKKDRINTLGTRAGGITDAEFNGLQTKLDEQLKAGDITPAEHDQLMATLAANRLVRSSEPTQAEQRRGQQLLDTNQPSQFYR